jgi:DNA polymerase elongation subunit (family B)
LVDRRVCLRQLLKNLPDESLEAKYCEDQADTIKKILVCLYGTTGSYWNKYGNVLSFEEINSKSREILLKTKDLVQRLGFELVYADTDACFVRKQSATESDYNDLVDIVSKETRLAISLEYHYKFLVLLPLEADEKLEALKHYFGKIHDGKLIMRGIETRRHDSPGFIKDFQTELLYALFDADSSSDIVNRTLEDALLCVAKTIDKIMTGQVEIKELVISKQMRMDITEYKNLFPHVAAAIQLSNSNSTIPHKGDNIEYVYVDSQHQNPLRRVVAAEYMQDGNLSMEYDREKYREMLLDASETVLGIFGFDRTIYGKSKDKRWWQELRRSRLSDISAELISNES